MTELQSCTSRITMQNFLEDWWNDMDIVPVYYTIELLHTSEVYRIEQHTDVEHQQNKIGGDHNPNRTHQLLQPEFLVCSTASYCLLNVPVSNLTSNPTKPVILLTQKGPWTYHTLGYSLHE